MTKFCLILKIYLKLLYESLKSKTVKNRKGKNMKKMLILGMTVLILSLAFVGCDPNDNPGSGGKDITLEGSDELPLGATFDLSVAKFFIDSEEVTDVEITWAIKDAKGTGATVEGTTLNANEIGIGTNWGEIILTATAVGQDFTKDFTFYLKRWNPTTKTAYLTAVKGSGYGAWETGDAIFISSVVNNFTLAAETEYTVAVTGTVTGELGDDSFQFYFINTAPPNYNFLALSYYENATITEDLGGAGTATAIVTTNDQFTGTNRSYDRIGIQISKGEQGVPDSDIGKVMLKISNITVSIDINTSSEDANLVGTVWLNPTAYPGGLNMQFTSATEWKQVAVSPGTELANGTYTVSGNIVTVTILNQWNGTTLAPVDPPQESQGTISGNSLVVDNNGTMVTFTKQQ